MQKIKLKEEFIKSHNLSEREVALMEGHFVQFLHDLVWMARRYADGRKTGAPDAFNRAYKGLCHAVDFDEENDPDNRTDETRPIYNFPLATSGFEQKRK